MKIETCAIVAVVILIAASLLCIFLVYNRKATNLLSPNYNRSQYTGTNPFTDSVDQCGDETMQTCASGKNVAQSRKQIDNEIDFNVENATDDHTFTYNPNNNFGGELCNKILNDSSYDGETLMWSQGQFIAKETRDISCYLCKSDVKQLDSNDSLALEQITQNKDCRGPVQCIGAHNSPLTLNGQIYYPSSGYDNTPRISNAQMKTKDLTVEYILGGAYPPQLHGYWSFDDKSRAQIFDNSAVYNFFLGSGDDLVGTADFTMINNVTFSSEGLVYPPNYTEPIGPGSYQYASTSNRSYASIESHLVTIDSEFSCAMWVKIAEDNDATEYQRLFQVYHVDADTGEDILLAFSGYTNNFQLITWHSHKDGNTPPGAIPLEAGKFSLLVFTFLSDGTTKSYVDGVLSSEHDSSILFTKDERLQTGTHGNQYRLYFGNMGTQVQQMLHGTMHQILMWERALSSTEVQELHAKAMYNEDQQSYLPNRIQQNQDLKFKLGADFRDLWINVSDSAQGGLLFDKSHQYYFDTELNPIVLWVSCELFAETLLAQDEELTLIQFTNTTATWAGVKAKRSMGQLELHCNAGNKATETLTLISADTQTYDSNDSSLISQNTQIPIPLQLYVVCTDTRCTIFVNNEQICQDTTSSYLTRIAFGEEYTTSYNGICRLDEVALWDRILSSGERSAIHKAIEGRLSLIDMPITDGALTACGATPTVPAGTADEFQVEAQPISLRAHNVIGRPGISLAAFETAHIEKKKTPLI